MSNRSTLDTVPSQYSCPLIQGIIDRSRCEDINLSILGWLPDDFAEEAGQAVGKTTNEVERICNGCSNQHYALDTPR